MSDIEKHTEVVPEVIFLGKLVERVVAGKIRVPKFQRDFVWNQPDLSALLDSVRRGFPIGSILVWDTEKGIQFTPRIGPLEIKSSPEGSVGYLLDGQQRVSTLAGTLRLTDDMQPVVDHIDWRVYYDLDEQTFIDHRKLAKDSDPRYFPVRCLLNTAGFFEACRRIHAQADDERRAQRRLDEADRLSSTFRDYQLPLIRIREADLESAVTVFARLNRTGRKMAADELVSALTYQEGQFHLQEGQFHLTGMLNGFKAELRKLGFGSLDRVFLLRSVLAALEEDIYAKEWADLMVRPEVRERLRGAFKAATQGIRLALGMLKRFGVTSDRLLPYGLQLVLLGEFHRLCPQPAETTVALLRRWFWVTSFTGWFGGVNTAQAKRALEEIRGLAKGKDDTFNVVHLDMPALAFPDRFDTRSARVRAFLLYLASLRPRSLRGDADLEPGSAAFPPGNRCGGLRVVQPRSARTRLQSRKPLVRGRGSCRAGVGRAVGAGRRGAEEAASDARFPGRLHWPAPERRPGRCDERAAGYADGRRAGLHGPAGRNLAGGTDGPDDCRQRGVGRRIAPDSITAAGNRDGCHTPGATSALKSRSGCYSTAGLRRSSSSCGSSLRKYGSITCSSPPRPGLGSSLWSARIVNSVPAGLVEFADLRLEPRRKAGMLRPPEITARMWRWLRCFSRG